MNGKPIEVPSLDALASDLSKVNALTPEAAKALWLEIMALEKVVAMRALTSSQNGCQEPTKNTALLTAKQVAERLNVPKSFVYEAARQGKLKPVKLGEKYVRFTQGTVDEYLTKSGA